MSLPRSSAGALLWVALLATAVPSLAAPARSGSTLTVFAAASLSESFGELAADFEAAEPAVKIRFNFAGSQQLLAQMLLGAQADVFASADTGSMGAAARAGLLQGAPRLFARNRLAVIVPRTNPARIDRIQDLARRGVRLVLGADAVPVGRYAREALRRLARLPGYPPGFEARVLANAASQEENVKLVVAKVQLGEADAGIVYRSDVTPAVARFVTVLEIPGAANVPAEYPVSVARGARDPGAARRFVELLLSPRGQAALRRHGLIPALPAGD